jgi:hypothetical protein
LWKSGPSLRLRQTTKRNKRPPSGVGKGTGGGAWHLGCGRNGNHLKVINECGEENVIVSVIRCDSEAEALSHEKRLIAGFRALGYEVTNQTDKKDTAKRIRGAKSEVQTLTQKRTRPRVRAVSAEVRIERKRALEERRQEGRRIANVLTEKLNSRVLLLCEEQDWSQNDLDAKVKYPRPHFAPVNLNAKSDIRILDALVKAFNMSIAELMRGI